MIDYREYFSNCCHSNSEALFTAAFENPPIEGICPTCGEHAVFEKEEQKKESAMKLQDITTLLFLVMGDIEKTIPELEELETEYWQTYYKYLMTSTMSSAPMREAEARTRIAQDDGEMHEKYLHKKADLRVLIHKKEALIEISRNLRALESNKKGGEL